MTAAGTVHTMSAFAYKQVALKNGHWKQQQDETIEMYLGIANDDLLHIFRQKAGLASTVHGLAGWYGAGASTFGQKLGAFAKLYRVTGDYRLLEKAIYLADEWITCADRSPRLYDNDTYVYDEASLYITQYLPSKVSWEQAGSLTTLENYSLYPEEESRIKLRIGTEQDAEFQLKLRVPSWATGLNSIKVNGEPLNVAISPNEWATVSRVWSDGDLVEVDFPFSLYFRAVDKVNQDIVALNYGPLVLVADKMTQFIGNAAEPSAWIHPAASKPDSFVTNTGHVAGYDFLTRNFSPYYKVGAMQWYYMYNRIQLPT